MRLFELQSEQINNLEIAKKIINANCMKSFAAMQQTHKLLFRGIPTATNQIFIGQSEKGRQPRNTRPKFHNAINKRLRQSGFKALRNNSIFVTTNHIAARNYGFLFAIFPFDNCDITWSTEYSDMTTDIGLQHLNSSDDKDELTDPNFSNDDFITKHGFQKDNLLDAMQANLSHREIYIHGEYLAIPVNYKNSKILNGWVGRDNEHDNWFARRHTYNYGDFGDK